MATTGLEHPISTITFADEYYSESSYLGDRDNSFPEDFIVGDRVWLNGIYPARIQYIGETHLGPGDDWAGLVLDEPIGKHDGQVNGRRYFYCENKKGIFARLSKLTRIPLRAQEPDSGARSPSARHRAATPTSILKKGGRSSSASRSNSRLDNSFDSSYSYEYEYNSNRMRSTPIRSSSANRSSETSNSFEVGYQNGYNSGYQSGLNAALTTPKTSPVRSPIRSPSPIRPVINASTAHYSSSNHINRCSRPTERSRASQPLQSPGVLRSLSRSRSKSRERVLPIAYEWEQSGSNVKPEVGRDGRHKSPYDRLERRLEHTIQTSFDSGIEREGDISPVAPVDDPVVRKEISYEHKCSRLGPKGRPNDLGRAGDVMERNELYEKYERTEVGKPLTDLFKSHKPLIEIYGNKSKAFDHDRSYSKQFKTVTNSSSSNESNDNESINLKTNQPVKIEVLSDDTNPSNKSIHTSDKIKYNNNPSIDKQSIDYKPNDNKPIDYKSFDNKPIERKSIEHKSIEIKPIEHKSIDAKLNDKSKVNETIEIVNDSTLISDKPINVSTNVDDNDKREQSSLTGKVSRNVNDNEPKRIEVITSKPIKSNNKAIKIKPAAQTKHVEIKIEPPNQSNDPPIIPIERNIKVRSSVKDKNKLDKQLSLEEPRTSTAMSHSRTYDNCSEQDRDLSSLEDETAYVIKPINQSKPIKPIKQTTSHTLDQEELDFRQDLDHSSASNVAYSKPTLRVGDRVLVESSRGWLTGQLKYLGPTNFKAGHWAGVQLDQPMGKNDGKVEGIRYFTCKPNYGLFAPCFRVHKDTKSPNLLNRVTRFAKDTLNVNK